MIDSEAVLIGAKLPNSGPLPMERGIPELARTLEQRGADSVWVADHVVLAADDRLARTRSPPTAARPGRSDTPYLEALIALALAAAATERVGSGPPCWYCRCATR